jgi:transcriptional regulator with XRE-family HTH domain
MDKPTRRAPCALRRTAEGLGMAEAVSKAGLRPVARGGDDARRRTDVDRHVAARIRERRVMLGLSQQGLADLIGVTYQQAHKYERAINRISAGRLFAVAGALGVEVGYFFEGLEDAPAGRDPQGRRLLDLARDFAAIADQRRREALCNLARAMATGSGTGTNA